MVKRYIFGALLLCCMIGIFMYSSKPGDESTEQSYRVGKLVGSLFVPGFNSWTPEKQMEFAARIDHPVRKTAHATEYAVLGLFAMLFCLTFEQQVLARTPMTLELLPPEEERKKMQGIRRKVLIKLALWAFAFCVAYAASDEIHQLFVPGRSGKVTDVLIDSAGAAVTVVLVSFLHFKLEKKRTGASL